MSELKTNLEAILQEKQNKIIPENIKKDIQIFDVIGTYEGGGSSTTGVKLFETEEEMRADSTAQEGDLAVVYRENIQNMTADTQTQLITFPETVVLPEAFTGEAYCMLRAADETVMFDGQVMLNQSMFDFRGYTENGVIIVSYISSDGITYNRDKFMGDSGDLTNPVDLGTVVGVYSSEEWNDNLGYFMQIGGMAFDGLFEYNSKPDINYITDLDGIVWKFPIDLTGKTIISFSGKEVPIITSNYQYSNSVSGGGGLIKVENFEVLDGYNQIKQCKVFYPKDSSYIYHTTDLSNNNVYSTIALKDLNSDTDNRHGCQIISITEDGITDIKYSNDEMLELYSSTIGIDSLLNENYNMLADESVNKCFLTNRISGTSQAFATVPNMGGDLSTVSKSDWDYDVTINSNSYMYRIANNQYTLTNSNQLLPNVSAYGKSGNVTGDGSIYNNLDEGIVMTKLYGLNGNNDYTYANTISKIVLCPRFR